MGDNVSLSCNNLVIVKHPEKGDENNGKLICDEIRGSLAEKAGQVCIFHDATHMSWANSAYAGAFKELNKDLEGRVVEVVCAIPGSIPRMMACTVAMFSDLKWSIFKTKDEAKHHLRQKGFNLHNLPSEDAGQKRLVNIVVK